MINVTKLLTGMKGEGDDLRYTIKPGHKPHGVSAGRGPVVVWNSTRACNLTCKHCYANACPAHDPDEMSTEEAKVFIDNLAAFQVPVLLFSGGEPLIRKDIYELISYASSKGLRPVVSTNGTLITMDRAKMLKEAGVKYVGVSLDGLEERHDEFRGRKGAFKQALQGIRNCLVIGQKVGVRFTISRHTYEDLDGVLDLIERENIPRACFYHLVYSGRGSALQQEDVTHEQSRHALDRIMAKTMDLHGKGKPVELLTVDNHADGVYLYQRMMERDPERAAELLGLLQRNGGNRSGIAIGCVDWHGNVYPDQFTRDIEIGNIRKQKFSEIWRDAAHPLMVGLRDRKPLLKGRCRECNWLDICNGNFRARASVSGDFWAEDPSCYLSDREIGIV
ncbi:radical SAM protein [Paenibacillus polymyxa]|uniref:radical SAM/SPASM domain-containing protein n=1 Tax=Paenibacillus TaxID=44249 RepID=UPI0004D8E61E|nr:radical SAM protein [Paenibacillus polymyxa]KEO79839.1 Fe-S oxidoreductase [Paenibacillus polymyxa]MCH6188346.1 radical SAM protein [Paenibacillus polymyxa]MDY8093533.1 radical SAM protein [Paenibacillus polymyxa]WRL61239.1 radical SAM protein [Paenibacillus polymyxa]